MRKHLAAVAMLLLLCGGMGSSALLSRAFAQSQHLSAVQQEKRIGPKPTPLWYRRWVQWRLGEGYAKRHALKPALRPMRAPEPIPNWAWRRLHFFLLARFERMPAAQKRPRGHKPPSQSTTTSGTTTGSTTTTTTGTTTTSTTTTTTTTPPPGSTIKGYYDQGADNMADWNAYRPSGFNLVFAPVGDTTLLSGLKADGASAWVQPNIWTGCGYSYSNAQALAYAKTAVATGAVSGFYVADEPSTSGCPTAPSQIASWTATLHANFPGIPTIIAAYSSTELAQFAHSADEFALDTYPCQYSNGCNYSWITQLAAAADNLGLKYVGVAQAFGGDSAGHYELPTASQMQQILNTWKATNELGYVVYAFSAEGMPSSSWLQNDPGLLSTIAAN
jgi:hypothetical protein